MTKKELKKNSSENISHIFSRRASAVIVLIVSIFLLIGWALKFPFLISMHSGWPAVAPLAALGFFVSALISLGLSSSYPDQTRWRRGLLAGLSLGLLVMGILVIGRYIYGWNFKLDEWPFENIPPSLDTKIAPATAICFVLTALWYLVDVFKPRFATFKMLSSLSIILTSGLIVVAYIYGASSLYQLPVFIKMSIWTAIQFLILHLGLLISDLPSEMELQSPVKFWKNKNTSRERPLYISLLLVFAAFLIAGIYASNGLNKLVQTISLVSETQTRVDQLDQLLLSLINAESGQRGYLLTGEEDYLDPYFQGTEDHSKNMEALRSWVAIHPPYDEAFNEIERNSEIKFKDLADTIILFRTQGFEAARKVVQTDLGKETMKRIRESIAFIKKEQVQVLQQQKIENQNQVQKTVTSITVGSFLAGILLLVSLNLYVKNSLKRSEVEEEVRRLNYSLENKIHEVEVVNKELESFSYSVSHDLRTPLRAMSGFSNILLEDHLQSLNEEGQKYLKRIIAAAEKMGQLINGILELSRISRHDVKHENISLSSLAKQQIEELQQLEPERKVEIVIEPDLEVRGDAMLLSVFLQNLLGNSWKFTAKKETPKIELGSFQRGGQQVYFIRDNGAGFDMAYSEKLFGTFQRLHTEAEFSGTGVGLATARRIVHLHGGDIWAEAKVNEGATFYFTLNEQQRD